MNLGFVGAGAVARHHLGVIARRSDVEVAAVCDLDAQQARAAAEATGARAYADWRAMLDTESLEALIVCTPPEAHVEPTVAALAHGTAAYVEKPLARTLADGLRIVAAWEDSEAVCAVGYQWRSLDLLSDLRAALGGATPGMLVSRSFGPTERARGDLDGVDAATGEAWFVDPRRSGGILFELGSHDIDLQLAIAGPVDSVQGAAASGLLALAAKSPTRLRDSVAAILHFSGGTVGTIQVAWTDAQEPPVYTLDVLTSRAALQLELDPVFQLQGKSDGRIVSAAGATNPRESTLSRFFDAVRHGDRAGVACSPADGLATLRVALACERAIETACRVDVADVT
jgi:predicted dehydrogenase